MNTQNLINILNPTIETAQKMNWEDKRVYALWSAQTYYFVLHSTRLFALAAARCPVKDNKFHFRFLKHLNDEKGHENLSINDIKFLDYNLSDLPEVAATKSLYMSQYFWIEHVSPYSFFGYLLALEGLAVHVGGEVYQRIFKHYGEKSAKFLKTHTGEDIEHLSEVMEWLCLMPQLEKQYVKENLIQTAETYKTMLETILRSSSIEKTTLAA